MEAAEGGEAAQTRIHVGGLGETVTPHDLRKIFSPMGEVEAVDIINSKGRSFAFVDFFPASLTALSRLFSTYNGCVWKGGRLRLGKAKEPFLTRLSREWAEDAFLLDDARRNTPSSLTKPNKDSDKQPVKIFFPRLRKVKSIPFSGTGKHKYSFQRVEAAALPIHFCDCEEHSCPPRSKGEKQIHEQEKNDVAMNEDEINLMTSVMNKLLDRENNLNTDGASEEKVRNNSRRMIEDLHSEEDEDDLIINAICRADNKVTQLEKKEGRTMSAKRTKVNGMHASKEGEAESMHKVRKKNVLLPIKKRTLLLNERSEKNVVASVVQRLEGTATSDEDKVPQQKEEETEADEDDDNDDLVINVVSKTNSRMTSSKHRELEKVSLNEKFEAKSSEDGYVRNVHEVQKENLLHSNKRKSIISEESHQNESFYIIPEGLVNSQTCSNVLETSLVSQPAKPDSCPQESSTNQMWSQKSSWRCLVGDRGSSNFTLSNILSNTESSKEEQPNSDGMKVDLTVNDRDKYATVSDKLEVLNGLVGTQMGKPGPSKSSRGAAWLHSCSWMQLISNNTSSFRISENFPACTPTSQDHRNLKFEDAVKSITCSDDNLIKLDKSEFTGDDPLVVEAAKEGIAAKEKPNLDPQTVMGGKDVASAAEKKDSSIAGTCSFMRSAASLKEWENIRAALSKSQRREKITK